MEKEYGMRRVLTVDIGGSHVKILLEGQRKPRKFDSGPDLTPRRMAAGVKKLAADLKYDVITIGIPTPIRDNRPVAEPFNLGKGWVRFDYRKAFGKPVRVINDAAMQALGSYSGGKMLFLGLGTGLGTTMIVNGIVMPMELGHLPYLKGTFEDHVGQRGMDRFGKAQWRHFVHDTIVRLQAALQADEVVIGGGNVRHLKILPPGCRAGKNVYAFRGGFRLWKK